MRKADWVGGQPLSAKKGSYRGGKGGRHFRKCEVPTWSSDMAWAFLNLGAPNSVSKV